MKILKVFVWEQMQVMFVTADTGVAIQTRTKFGRKTSDEIAVWDYIHKQILSVFCQFKEMKI